MTKLPAKADYTARAARLNRLADKWLNLCEKATTLKDMREARMLVGAVCQIENTLKSLRFEERGLEPESGLFAGSAVRKYSESFAAGGGVARSTGTGSVFIDDGSGPGDDGDSDAGA